MHVWLCVAGVCVAFVLGVAVDVVVVRIVLLCGVVCFVCVV